MSAVTSDVLRAALARHRSPGGGTRDESDSDSSLHALIGALESIGWRGDDVVEAEEVASLLLPHLEACARQHQDMTALYRDIAGILRGSGPLLDGGLPPASDYLPAAEEVVRAFVVS